MSERVAVEDLAAIAEVCEPARGEPETDALRRVKALATLGARVLCILDPKWVLAHDASHVAAIRSRAKSLGLLKECI